MQKEELAKKYAEGIMEIYGMYIQGPMKEQREEYKKMFMEDLVKLSLGEEISRINYDTYKGKTSGMCDAGRSDNDLILLVHLAKKIKKMLELSELPLEQQILELSRMMIISETENERLNARIKYLERDKRCR